MLIRRSLRPSLLALAVLTLIVSCAPRTDASRDDGRVSTGATTGRDVAHTLAHDGRRRSYDVHTPPGYDPLDARRYPVVIVYHGGGGNAASAARMSCFSDLADRERFIAVYPNGSGRFRNRLLTWNSGGIPVYATEHDVDDVGFTRAMIDALDTAYAIDRTKIYATGMSNGGMMVHRLAREAADLFAAVCDVSGAMNFTERAPSAPIGVMMIHGRADEHVRFEGGRPKAAVGDAGERTDTSVADAIAFYVAHNELDATPVVTRRGPVETSTYAHPRRAAARHRSTSCSSRSTMKATPGPAANAAPAAGMSRRTPSRPPTPRGRSSRSTRAELLTANSRTPRTGPRLIRHSRRHGAIHRRVSLRVDLDHLVVFAVSRCDVLFVRFTGAL